MTDRSWMENPNNVICSCGAEIWAYMVHDAVWAAAGFESTDFACQECLSKKLNRPLVVPDDFTNVPINWANVSGFYTQIRVTEYLERILTDPNSISVETE